MIAGQARPGGVEWRGVALRAPSLALAALLITACDCGGGPVVWVGVRDAPRIVAFDRAGAPVGIAAGPPALDAPVRALLLRRDGTILALQEPEIVPEAASTWSPAGAIPTSLRPSA